MPQPEATVDPEESAEPQTSEVEYTEVDIPNSPNKLRVPKDQANDLIEFRQEFKKLKGELDTIRDEKVQAEKRVEQQQTEKEHLELAKKGELDALKDSLTKDYKEQVEQLQTQLVRQKVRDAIISNETVNKKAIDTIAKLVEYEKPSLDGDNVKVGDKSVIDFVSELIKNNDYFQVVQTPVGTGKAKTTTPQGPTENQSSVSLIKEGLQEFDHA